MKKLIDDLNVVGVIGLAKNSGKTTTLNHMIALYEYLKIGITSIGLDGESLDQVNFLPKPKIKVKRGMVVATASGCLEASFVRFQVLDKTDFHTALGRIQIVEVLSDGHMVVAGPTTNKEMNQVLMKMKLYTDKIFVDGAFNRMTFANIDQIDGIVLATGAVVSPFMQETIKETKVIVDAFNLHKSYRIEHTPSDSLIIQTTFHRFGEKNKKLETIKHIVSNINDKIDLMYIKGAITPRVIHFFIEHMMSDFTLVCDDATKLLIKSNEYDALHKLNIDLSVVHPCPLVCVTINPWSSDGRHYPIETFLREMKASVGIPVFNVLSEEENHV